MDVRQLFRWTTRRFGPQRLIQLHFETTQRMAKTSQRFERLFSINDMFTQISCVNPYRIPNPNPYPNPNSNLTPPPLPALCAPRGEAPVTAICRFVHLSTCLGPKSSCMTVKKKCPSSCPNGRAVSFVKLSERSSFSTEKLSEHRSLLCIV